MADLSAAGADQSAAGADLSDTHAGRRWLALGLLAAAALVVVAVVRVAVAGWQPIAPDDARYLYVGLSTFAGDGPVTPAGNVFLLRAPVYGLLLASGSLLVGGDPVVGARVVASGLALLGLAGALRVAWLLAGPGATLGTAAALLATPLVWRLVPSLRVDLPQTAGVIAILLALWRPTPGRWAVAGVLFGVTLLVKETILPLAVLPLVLVGLEPPRRLLRLWGIYLGCGALVAAWWWVVVWLQAGVIFPLNAVGVIEARDVAAGLRIGAPALGLVAIALIGWGTMLVRARTERGPRLLVGALAALLPAAIYAISQGLNARNLAGVAVLTAIAIGAAGAVIVATLRGIGESDRWHVPPRLRAATIAAIGLLVAVAIIAGQRSVGPQPSEGASEPLIGWLRDHTTAGDHIAMTFRDRELAALRLFGEVQVAGLSAVRVHADDDLGDFLWLGLRDRQLFAYRRDAVERILGEDGLRYLALSGPHAFSPAELFGLFDSGAVAGLETVAAFVDGNEMARVYAVTPSDIDVSPSAVGLHLSPEAAEAWLDLAATPHGEAGAADHLMAARPLLVGGSVDALYARLGDRACLPQQAVGGIPLRSADDCDR